MKFKFPVFFFFNVVVLTFINCNTKGQVDIHNKNYKFISLTKKNDKYIIFKPCDASVKEIIIQDTTLVLTTDQDGDYKYSIVKKEKVDANSFSMILKVDQGENEVFSFNKTNDLWNINDRIFVEIKEKGKYEYIEQPCIECFSKEECEGVVTNNTYTESKTRTSKSVLNFDTYNIEKATFSTDHKWHGTYYFDNIKAELDYLITINDKLVLSVQGGYHGYSDQLKAVQVGDTLGLYHHKNLSGDNYDDTRSYDFLKFYKSSDGKYYFEGKLPYLPEGTIEFEKVK